MTANAMPLRLQVIVASTRPTRNADRVAPWVLRRAEAHPAFAVELLDLREWPLPWFSEHAGSIGDGTDPPYTAPIVKRWNATIAAADAYLVVTPEYNHGIPGVLKNALDSVFASFAFRNKPIGCVAYSTSIAAGARVVEQLALAAVEAELVPLRNSVLIPFVRAAFGDDGTPGDPGAETALTIALDDLAWWAGVLAAARPTQLPPARARS